MKYPDDATMFAVSVHVSKNPARLSYEQIEGGAYDETWAIEADTPDEAVKIAAELARSEGAGAEHPASLFPAHMIEGADRTVPRA